MEPLSVGPGTSQTSHCLHFVLFLWLAFPSLSLSSWIPMEKEGVLEAVEHGPGYDNNGEGGGRGERGL